MAEKLEQELDATLLRLLRPLARILLNHGLAYGRFAELARKAFVDEGFEHISRTGKRSTLSSVSALTGLTRKETKRLSEQDLSSEADSGQRYNRAIRVISGWLSDSRFQEPTGGPARLPLEDGEGSFSELVKEFSGDIPTSAMLSVLEASRNVAVIDGCAVLLERAYIPMNTPVDRINILGVDTAELIATIGHNLQTPPDQRFFQRKVSNTAIKPEALAAFREMSNRKSQELLEEYHSWLSQHEIESSAEGDDEQPAYVSVGIYYFEQTD